MPGNDGGEEPVIDAGRLDGGQVDAGKRDAGFVDSGTPKLDAGPIIDPGNCLRTPPWNKVVNAGFECAANTAWNVSNGIGTVVDGGHSGGKAMHAVTNAQGEARVGQDTVVADTDGKTYCAQVWAYGSSPIVRLEVRATPSGAGTASSSPLASESWIKVPPGGPLRVTSPRGESLSLLVLTQLADAGATLVVDDFELWLSPSGLCDEH